MTVKEFIQMVNEGEFWSLNAIDNSDLGEGFERIECGNNLDEHRWYSTAEDIYKLEDGYVGVYGLFQMFTELGYPEDCDVKCEAYEVEPVPSIKYVPKRK